jgi:hypothetical protein
VAEGAGGSVIGLLTGLTLAPLLFLLLLALHLWARHRKADGHE